MNKYIFILGQSSDLASQELVSFFSSEDKIDHMSNNFAIISTKKEASDIIKKLGGTIKIAEYIESIKNISELDENKWFSILSKNLKPDKKNFFGFSLYNNKNSFKNLGRLAMSLKKHIKNKGFKVRLVTSKEPILSSVIVAKNNLLGSELIIIFEKEKIHLGLTKTVQDFVAYSARDAYRPQTDDVSGMLPPKVAQMMLNLSNAKKDSVLLDPFCGSGTIIQESALMGIKKIYASDKNQNAVDSTKENISWLRKKYNFDSEVVIKKIDARHLENNITDKIDCIVSEPYMGNAKLIQKTNEIDTLEQIKKELQELYLEAFKQFYKLLSPNGKIVFAFPIFHTKNTDIYTLDNKIITKINLKAIKPDIQSNQLSKNGNIIYMRPGQKVLREITIWQK